MTISTFAPSRKFLAAVETVVDIAYHAGGVPVRHRDISRRQKIPGRYLEQMLQQLVRSDILVGLRGPSGGYRLARERRRITIAEICRAVSTKNAPRNMNDSIMANRVIVPLWQDIDRYLIRHLATITIEDLCQRARKSGVEREKNGEDDFSI